MSETRITSSTGGEKGSKKARFDLIPTRPLWAVAEHYGAGAEKYEDRNWERGYKWSLAYAAAQRHLNAMWGGEDIDEETGSPHLAAVIFHCMSMLEWADTHPEFDDRPSTKTEVETEKSFSDEINDLIRGVKFHTSGAVPPDSAVVFNPNTVLHLDPVWPLDFRKHEPIPTTYARENGQ